MFPDVTFLGLELYDWCMIAGIVLALIVARLYSDHLKIPAKLQNLIYITAIVAIAAGLGGAVLFQSVYNWIENGVFVWNGMTFYGGLICGAAVFLIGYFLVGKHICGNMPVTYFPQVSSMAACSIVIAHTAGRLGCFFAGCCYGRVRDPWYAISLPAVGEKGIPAQLFECIFLLILFVVLTFLLFRTKIPCFGVYLTAYAVFRFCIEFLRDDDRGHLVGALSPSQFWSILLFVAGLIFLLTPLVIQRIRRKKSEKAQPGD